MITFLIIIAVIVAAGVLWYHGQFSQNAINRKVRRDRARAARNQ
jgi:hypothetical protein